MKDKREEHDLQRQQLLQISSQFEARTTDHQQQTQALNSIPNKRLNCCCQT